MSAASSFSRPTDGLPAAPTPPGKTPELAAFLLGAWRIERTLLEHSTQQHGEFHGTLQFTHTDDGGLRYHEEGSLSWAAAGAEPGLGYRAPATRNYLLTPTEDPAALDWYFDGGGFFHRLDLRTGRWQAEHPCAADLYQVDYTVFDDGRLRVRWDVAGPRKNQLIDSNWTRVR